MANGLRAALSPNEDGTLRRIAGGGVPPKSLRDSDVARLKRLGLVEESRMGLTLSPLGHQRLYGTLPSPATAPSRHAEPSLPEKAQANGRKGEPAPGMTTERLPPSSSNLATHLGLAHFPRPD